MIERGKFRSLTLINWNGFFARTFDLDEFVTTLSGGNGAGKSTTMAAFVTALIPDLTLLHFRNTTEAGATSGSRDKGLHGKLRPGVCYAILDVMNSRHQRITCGVRLQQVAGRDKKVDIKPFIIQGLPMSYSPTQILTQVVAGRQARVLSLNEVKDEIEKIESVIFKQFNSITDYHALMFDLGVLSKRLRSSSDRSKFYRLIEASLYGGISSAITRSLRDYLLPENGGVRKAFQDMEAALRENRMTLEAIRMTQRDRDLFKHLITEATAYVAADYMRHANERRGHLESVLEARRELFADRRSLINDQYRHVEIARELSEYQAQYEHIEADYQGASDYLTLVQTAVRQQDKISRYQNDLDEIAYRLEEQTALVESCQEELIISEEKTQQVEYEVDELKTQLADYQQAVDGQQTRAIQYQQALQALVRAQDCCQLPNLQPEEVPELQKELVQEERVLTETLLVMEQKLSLTDAAQEKFEQAFALTQQLVGQVDRKHAWQEATAFLRQWPAQHYLATQLPALEQEKSKFEQRLYEQQQAERLLKNLSSRLGRDCSADELETLQQEIAAQIEELNLNFNESNEQQLSLKQELLQCKNLIEQLAKKAPTWLKAQEALAQLSSQCQTTFTERQDVTETLQQLLEQERELTVERDEVEYQKRDIEKQIERLSQPSGAEDARLIGLAERFGGILLSEIYDDVAIEDAAYFSAVYGPSRHAIVVSDLEKVREHLSALEDAPEDLYFIEGDPQSFDDSVFNTEEFEQAVLVKTAERQWRYSRFPEIPLFGRAARDQHLELLHQERDELAERYATLSFDVQKTQRLQQNLSQFIGQYLSVVFEDDPDAEIQKLQSRRHEIERILTQREQDFLQQRQQLEHHKETALLINRVAPHLHLLKDSQFQENYDQLVDKLELAEQAHEFVAEHQRTVALLEPIVAVLQSDPEDNLTLRDDYALAQATQRKIKEQLLALNDVWQRRAHFSYSDAIDVVSENNELNNHLRERLSRTEEQRNVSRQQTKQLQQQLSQLSQLQASLKSSFDAKQDVLRELEQEIAEIGVNVDEGTEARAMQRKEELFARLSQHRQHVHHLEKQLMQIENEMENLQKRLRKLEKDYYQQREQVVTAKKGWCNVLRLVKSNQVEQRLHRRELAYLGSDELRSMSDKALGALRLAVADNEHLRDVLRSSEDLRFPERKIQFYIAVYQHLRERIRQDIIKTDDPIEAIEQMEIELSRLTEELTAREQKLAISSKSVANIIRKTIQREQNRIRMLNQGLQTVYFGQVKSVRLNVNMRESHAMLLNVLSEQQEQHQDLFTSQRLTFSEALAKLYQRLNPHVDFGQRIPQTIGEELLDYRNYLELDVEVYRGTDGWLRAESGALSTGEAIGTGMSILVMVVQSWEEESRRLRGKDISPCRLLFLDEAARLDAKSIATLFELCDRLQMQLIIAAPENISPEKGTTYKLVRKVFDNHEHVHVVGLKGFAQPQDEMNLLQ